MENFDEVIEKLRVSLDPQEQKLYCYCQKCEKEIYKGEEYCETDEYEFLCEDCFDELQKQEKQDCLKVAGDDY